MHDKLKEKPSIMCLRPPCATRTASMLLSVDSPSLWNSAGGVNTIIPKICLFDYGGGGEHQKRAVKIIPFDVRLGWVEIW